MNKLSFDKKISLWIFAILAVAFVVFGFATQKVMANPYFFPAPVSSASATTTLTYFAVTATSSIVYDAFEAQTGSSNLNSNAINSASLLIQFTGSSSPLSVLKWRYEYAQDQAGVNCKDTPNACDWYSETVNKQAVTASTTIEVGDFKEYSWVFASSTPNGIASPQDRGLKLISVPTPTRYTRVVFYKQIGSANGGYWEQFVPIKENR